MDTMCASRKSDVEPIVHDHAGLRSPHGINALRHQMRQRAAVEILLTHLHQIHTGPGRRSDQRNQLVGFDAMSIGDETKNRFHGNRRG
jgi:hypothetical protein